MFFPHELLRQAWQEVLYMKSTDVNNSRGSQSLNGFMHPEIWEID